MTFDAQFSLSGIQALQQVGSTLGLVIGCQRVNGKLWGAERTEIAPRKMSPVGALRTW